MLILTDLPWFIILILAALFVLSGLGTLSISQSIVRPFTNRWTAGHLFMAGLVGLVLVAFLVLLLVSLLKF